MTVHRIWMPDSSRGGEPRSIDWDDVAGTAEGDHSVVARLAPWVDRVAAEGRVGYVMGEWVFRDPWRDAGEFLLLLRLAVTDLCWDPGGLPAAPRDVDAPSMRLYPPPPEAAVPGMLVTDRL